jgi:hypothetical protein
MADDLKSSCAAALCGDSILNRCGDDFKNHGSRRCAAVALHARFPHQRRKHEHRQTDDER